MIASFRGVNRSAQAGFWGFLYPTQNLNPPLKTRLKPMDVTQTRTKQGLINSGGLRVRSGQIGFCGFSGLDFLFSFPFFFVKFLAKICL